MLQVHDGQCGLCVHYGEDHSASKQLVELRTKKSAPETMLEECAHPKHAALHLRVTPISACDGFAPASKN